MKNERGITLIALIVTVIVLIIIAGITISNIIKHQIIKISIDGTEAYSEEVKKETSMFDKIIEIIGFKKTDEEEKTISISYNDSLIGKVANIAKAGIQDIEVNGVTYSTNVIIHNGDIVLDGVQEVNGATLKNNVYEFGNKETDVAKGTDEAKNMVIFKVNGNITINQGVTVTSCKSDNGLGGPKGFLIHCSGTLTNNGTISMTARGAKAKGQNVYLWKNEDGSYEYIPAEGGAGASGASIYGSIWNPSGWYYGIVKGNNAINSCGRALAGGGSGSAGVSNQHTVKSYSGAKATSYSGGSGSGGTFSAKESITGYAPEANGGMGGKAYTNENSGYSTASAGGAGNPGGAGYISSGTVNQTRTTGMDGENGTRWIIDNIFQKIYK